jgi:hypothetical protein
MVIAVRLVLGVSGDREPGSIGAIELEAKI